MMQSDLQNGLNRPPSRQPPPLSIPPTFTSSREAANEHLSPQSPVEFRRRSLQSPHPSQLSHSHSMNVTEPEKKTPIDVSVQSISTPPLSSSASSTTPPKATFWQDYFCRPADSDQEKAAGPSAYRFSIKARGSLICAAVMLIALFAVIIAPVLAGTIKGHKGNKTVSAKPNGGSGFDGSGVAGNVGNPSGGTVNSANITLAINENFPDPWIMEVDGTWYAYATNTALTLPNGANQTAPKNPRANVQVATSTDFVNWNVQSVDHDPLPAVGQWSVQGFKKNNPVVPKALVWAPGVFQRPGDKKWVMYYSAITGKSDFTHCIGAAVSDTDSPMGPFTPIQQSFACPINPGGAIDPAPIIDGGDTYIAYKVDGNNRGNGGSCGNTKAPIKSTPIMLQKTKDDGITPDGDPVQILDRTDADGPLVEAPSLVKSDDGTYFLFFSSGCTHDPSYTVKYATASKITGPYTRAKDTLLKTGDAGLLAPGSCTVTKGSMGHWRMAFHARVKATGGTVRAMFTAGIALNGTTASITNINL